MPHMMQAAVVEAFGRQLTLREFANPAAGPGPIPVKTEACGVCHTGPHAARRDWPVKPAPSFIAGDKGIAIEVGAGVEVVKLGDGVGVPWMDAACGHRLEDGQVPSRVVLDFGSQS